MTTDVFTLIEERVAAERMTASWLAKGARIPHRLARLVVTRKWANCSRQNLCKLMEYLDLEAVGK